MKRKKTLAENIKNATEAHTDLCILAALVTLMEGGDLSAKRHLTQARITKIIHAEQQRCLRDYDRAVASAHR